MPPGRKKVDSDNKTIIQSYIQAVNQPNSDAGETIIAVAGDEVEESEGDGEVTYYMDNDGQFYYQPVDDKQNNFVALATGEDQMVTTDQAQILMPGENYQSLTIVPTKQGNEVSYVLVVEEDDNPQNISIKVDKDQDQDDEMKGGGTEDVYSFEDEEGGIELSDDEEEEDNKSSLLAAKKKQSRNQYSCSFCAYVTNKRYLLRRHMKSHSEERPHKCEVCERGFKTLPAMQNHMNMHNGVKPHVCKYCSNRFTTSGELVRHVRYKHTHEKPHKCTECDYASVELSKLRRHVRCHTGERPYQCPHCTYASPDTFKLKRHLRTHSGEKPYKCDECNMCFTQSNSLKAHKLIHNVSQKPVYACELCPAKCGRKTDLRIHIQKLHTSDKPIKCKRCGKSFPDRYSCKVHNKTHEGEKCYKCELCPYASTTLRHLNSHMYKHTDEKPFQCDLCDQAFRQKQLLKRHQNLYHDPHYVPKPPKEKTHVCHECKRTFAHKGNLIRHLAVHDPESVEIERNLALKLGLQKKVTFKAKEARRKEKAGIVKLDVNEGEYEKGGVVTVADENGQQYVVFEVIQLDDGTEQHVIVNPKNYDENEIEELEVEEEEEEEEEEEDEEQDFMIEMESKEELQKSLKTKSADDFKREVGTCFGFDEEDEEEIMLGI